MRESLCKKYSHETSKSPMIFQNTILRSITGLGSADLDSEKPGREITEQHKTKNKDEICIDMEKEIMIYHRKLDKGPNSKFLEAYSDRHALMKARGHNG